MTRPRQADWLEIDEAQRIMLRHMERVGTEQVSLTEALGRTLAEPLISPIHQPPWDNSAMDGYAVRSADVGGATDSAPVLLRVVDDVPAGGFPSRAIAAGEATRIMTGAPVPLGADGVIRREHVRSEGTDRIAVLSAVDAGRNIRFRGEDLNAGDSVFSAGRVLGAAEIGVLAMIGCTHPLVSARPRVAVLATGDELVEPDRIADVVAGTHIINSNTPAVSAALMSAGCAPVPLGIARDDVADLRARLEPALTADALITTAGASVGDHDRVKDALEEIGCETLFWRVKIRPGSPFSFGIVRRAARPPLPVFGLPGNPVSALVTLEILVLPALRAMLGRTALHPRTMTVTAGADIHSPKGLVRFLRVRLEPRTDAPPAAFLTGPQGSGILTSVAAADALLIMPLEQEHVPAGATARVVLLRRPDDAQDAPVLTQER